MSREADTGSGKLARARSRSLIVEELDGELLVYDGESNLAHALDAEVGALWRACDGRTDVRALAERCGSSPEEVRIALARLAELDLLEAPEGEGSVLEAPIQIDPGDTRRSALRKIGLAGAGLAAAPTISSILVPTAAHAASGTCVPVGGCAYSVSECCTETVSGTNPCVGPATYRCACVEAGSCVPAGAVAGSSACCSGASRQVCNSCSSRIRCCLPAGTCVPAGARSHVCCNGSCWDHTCGSGTRCK